MVRRAPPKPDQTSSSPPNGAKWLLLIHHLPGKPDYLRVKVRRRLARLGAVPLKSSVYVLPDSDSAREDFQWLLREIVADGGEAALCESSVLGGVSDEELRALFRRDRDAEYASIIEAASTPLGGDDVETRRATLERRLREAQAIDFFHGRRRDDAIAAVASLTRARPGTRASTPSSGGRPMNRVWVTRRGIKVDRIGSAWLIRKAIDPEARFKYVDPNDYSPEPGELRFDMFGGEYTHEGPRCTFESLLAHFEIADPALAALGEIVHDVDCKDAMYGRAEAPGLAAFVQGLATLTADDEKRLERGSLMFDALYSSFGGSAPT